MLSKIFTAFFLTLSVQASAFMALDLDLTNGWRSDQITSFVDVFDPADVLTEFDNLTAKHISMYQIGLKGYWDLCGWLVRLEGDYACSNSGNYDERFGSIGGAVHLTEADLHKAKAKDLILGTGYSFCFFRCVTLGVLGGWSYHHQEFKLHDPRTDGIPDPVLEDLKYTNRWQGPWAGTDLTLRVCGALVRAGYEYHWPHWHATWELDGPDIPGVAFSDHRRSHNTRGQVATLDIRWSYCEWWNFGLGVKYQYWKAWDGKLKPIFNPAGFSPTEIDKVRKATWRSIAITFDIGYLF